MNEDLIKQIEELGLSNKEARVYIANLMLGAAGVQQIADTSGIKRVTTYVILESLVNLGLVSQTNKAKKTLFNAESPTNLQRLLEKKEQSLAEQKDQLKALIPDLKSLKGLPKDNPQVKFYDGADSIQTLNKAFFSQSMKAGSSISYGISNLDLLYKYLPQIQDTGANPVRMEAGVKSKFIYTASNGPILHSTDTQANRESRFVPKDKYSLECDISISGNLVAMLSLGGNSPIGISIESEQIANGMRSVFDLAWETAEKYN